MRVKHGRITLRYLRRQAELVDTHEKAMRNHSDRALDHLVTELREVFHRGRQDEETVRRSLAAIREVARRETGEEPYIVQLMSALALYHGRIVQMLTGERQRMRISHAAARASIERVIEFLKTELDDSDAQVAAHVQHHHGELAQALASVPGVGHAPELDEPEAAAAIDSFLAGLEQGLNRNG